MLEIERQPAAIKEVEPGGDWPVGRRAPQDMGAQSLVFEN
jgi:hypothetical protein